MTKLAAKYSGFSTIDKMKYCRTMTHISTWASLVFTGNGGMNGAMMEFVFLMIS